MELSRPKWVGQERGMRPFAFRPSDPTGQYENALQNTAEGREMAMLARIEALEEAVMQLQQQREIRHSVAFEVDPVDVLREACRDLAIPISGDGFVREHDAARLL